MNLEEELRAVLSQEAEMRTTPTPDIEGMVNGGQGRLRRRNTMRIGLAAAAALLIGGGVYGIAQIGDDDADAGVANLPSEPAEAANPALWTDTDGGPVDPGTYRAYVGADADGKNIGADLTISGMNWRASNYPVAYEGEHFAGIGAYQPESVARGCGGVAGLQPAAADQQRLAQQLAQMPRSDTLQQPTRTTAFGHSAVHLRLRLDSACNGAAYIVAETPAGSRGISYYDATPEVSGIVIIDFWVVDLDGTTVVVDMFHTQDAPRNLTEQAAAARESITLLSAE